MQSRPRCSVSARLPLRSRELLRATASPICDAATAVALQPSVSGTARNTHLLSILSAVRRARPASEHERPAVDSTRHEPQPGCATVRCRRHPQGATETRLPTLSRTAPACQCGRHLDAVASATAPHADPSPSGAASIRKVPSGRMRSCNFLYSESMRSFRFWWCCSAELY